MYSLKKEINIWTKTKIKVSPGYNGNPEKRHLNDRKIREETNHTHTDKERVLTNS